MKIMYVAANPLDESSLMIEAEITELQGHVVGALGDDVTFLAFPSLSIENLPLELARQKPDILHISAHGGDGKLRLAKADRTTVELTGNALRAFLDRITPPKLVYVNACDSREIAQALVDRTGQREGVPVQFAIGTTAPVTNRAARAAAALFYSRILDGYSVAHAFEGGKLLIEGLQNSGASAMLFSSIERPDEVFFYQKPLLVARLLEEDVPVKRAGTKKNTLPKAREYSFEYGVIGLPSCTTQVVLFTDDEDFLPETLSKSQQADGEESAYAAYLCRVVRSRPVRGVLWIDSGWSAHGDFRIAAVGISANGRTFSMSSMLTEALSRYYTGEGWSAPKVMSEGIVGVIQNLRLFDGTTRVQNSDCGLG